MIRSLGLAVALIGLCATSSKAAPFTVFGSGITYAPLAGAADPLGIVGRDFSVRLDLTGSTINSGYIRILSGAGSHFSIPLNGGGVVTNAGSTIFNVPGPPGLQLTFGTVVTGFTSAELNALKGVSGGMTLLGDFGGGNVGQYSAGITAVPEPGSLLALTGLVTGCGFYRRRRR